MGQLRDRMEQDLIRVTIPRHSRVSGAARHQPGRAAPGGTQQDRSGSPAGSSEACDVISPSNSPATKRPSLATRPSR